MVSEALLIDRSLIGLVEWTVCLVAHDVLLNDEIDVVYLVFLLLLQLKGFDV